MTGGESTEDIPADRTAAAIQHLLHAMDDPVFAYDATGTVLYANRAYDELFRTTHPSGTLGMNVLDIEPGKRELVREMYTTNLNRRPADGPLVIESPSIGPDGRPRWFEWRNIQEFDESGNVTMVICLSRNITQQRLAELKAQRINERLQESNRDLLEFAQVASHDLREPLRKVAAFSDRLQRRLGDQLDDRANDYLGRMNSAVLRMQGLIDDLLTFARVNTRGATMESASLTGILTDVLSDLEIAIDEAQAVIDVGPLPDLPVDDSQIGQLFQNLIGNALKFRRPNEPPRVTITAEHSAPDGADDALSDGWWDITVRDNGIGFDEKYLSKIFTPFQRLHGRSDYDGSGVGLSVCRRIVERHQGHIWATSSQGQGAAFTFRLPTSHIEEIITAGDSHQDLSGLGVEYSIIDTRAA